LFAASTVAAGAAAHAEGKKGPRLVYSAPPECPNEAGFRADVAALLGEKEPFDAESADTLRVTFTKTADGYRGTVQLVPAQGEVPAAREKTGSPCELVATALAGVTSMTLRSAVPAATASQAPVSGSAQPSASAAPSGAPAASGAPVQSAAPAQSAVPAQSAAPAPSGSAGHAAPAPSGALPVASAAPSAAPSSTAAAGANPPPGGGSPSFFSELRYSVHAAALLSAGLTANVAPGFQIGAEARRDWLSLGLELRGVLPSVVYVRDPVAPGPTDPQQLDLSELGVAVVPCARFFRYFAGCAVAGVGVTIANANDSNDFKPIVALGPRLGVEVPFTARFAVLGFGEALFSPISAVEKFSQAGPNGNPPSPNVQWSRPFVSGFFGVGVSFKIR
jgi:hypothetical protein